MIYIDFLFNTATAFNQPIGTWSTAAVTSMIFLFNTATAFNQPIGTWRTAAVTFMERMFYKAAAFKQALCWDVTGKNIYAMFELAGCGWTGTCLGKCD